MADVAKFVDKSYEGKEFSELADAPVDALQGVSEGDAEHLREEVGLRARFDDDLNRRRGELLGHRRHQRHPRFARTGLIWHEYFHANWSHCPSRAVRAGMARRYDYSRALAGWPLRIRTARTPTDHLSTPDALSNAGGDQRPERQQPGDYLDAFHLPGGQIRCHRRLPGGLCRHWRQEYRDPSLSL